MANQININRPSTRVVIVSVILAILALIGHFLTRPVSHRIPVLARDDRVPGAAARSIVQGPLMTRYC
jgi:hypothetical protein